MISEVRRAWAWPLHTLGLEPGRALHNAAPDEQYVQAAREELWSYIAQRGLADAAHDELRRRRANAR
jgi:hypothetical protein